MARHSKPDDPSDGLSDAEKAEYLKGYAKNVRKGNLKLPKAGRHQKQTGKSGKPDKSGK